MKKKIDKLLFKAVEAGIECGLRWQSKVWLRCAIEGCRYGFEGIDKQPRDVCMYCGEQNMSKIYSKFPVLKSIQEELNKESQ